MAAYPGRTPAPILKMIALYIHIPFCKRKCSYCDFVSYAGHGEEIFARYADALCAELAARRDMLSDGISSIYMGGGTPSLLSPGHIEKIFSGISSACPSFSTDIEITIETNPATAGKEKLRDFRQLGINRISLGVQSFDDRLLSILGRIHTAKEAVRTYESCRNVGFENINLDLMFALPCQDMEMWRKDLQKAVFLDPQHLSVYNLQLEEGTPLWEEKKKNSLDFPSEDEDADMYLLAVQYLKEKGYSRYEISNFALDGRECMHNITYWQNGSYLGLGVAAHSHLNGCRRANTSSLEKYLSSPCNAVAEETKVTPLMKRQETIFLGLRMSQGVEKAFFTGYEEKVEELKSNGLLEEKHGKYRLTDKGILLANRVFEHFV
ncbi:MAG TPA: radical SAM family heme chaperone HemW [bacterium]|nr:radical SAM family heme chaperone HemW [bacterium]